MFTKKAKNYVSVEDLKNRIDDEGGLYEVIWSSFIQSKLKEYGIEFDCENFTEAESFDDEDEQFNTPGFKAGYDILCGIPVRWIAAGGDWEKPIGFCMYIDNDDKLNVYVPHDGNVYDKNKNAAYGNYECKTVYETRNEKYDQMAMRNEFCKNVGIEI